MQQPAAKLRAGEVEQRLRFRLAVRRTAGVAIPAAALRMEPAHPYLVERVPHPTDCGCGGVIVAGSIACARVALGTGQLAVHRRALWRGPWRAAVLRHPAGERIKAPIARCCRLAEDANARSTRVKRCLRLSLGGHLRHADGEWLLGWRHIRWQGACTDRNRAQKRALWRDLANNNLHGSGLAGPTVFGCPGHCQPPNLDPNMGKSALGVGTPALGYHIVAEPCTPEVRRRSKFFAGVSKRAFLPPLALVFLVELTDLRLLAKHGEG
mmetsp:Transcript_104658/g.327506  ORF Transcript_104658/g.327506 Transcript_104658/m.327506 type:complete len:267 (-) Transcript_104658:59-859(-)